MGGGFSVSATTGAVAANKAADRRLTYYATAGTLCTMSNTRETHERVNVTLPPAVATYLRERAEAELRTVSNMTAFMIEEYRRNHETAGDTSPK